MTRWRLPIVVLLAMVIAGCNACTTGSATLKAQSVTVDTLVLAGETAKLVAGPFDTLCPKRALPVQACDGWAMFIKGKAPTDPVCAAPAVPTIITVLDKCGFRKTYPFLDEQYKDKKDVAAGVASTAEAIIRQLIGFTQTVNAAQGR